MGLENVHVLRVFSKEHLEKLRPFLQIEKYSSNTVILREEELTQDLYFLLKGKAHVQKKEMILGSIEQGEHFGELSLLTNKPRTATIIADSDITLAKLSFENYNHLKELYPALALDFVQTIVSSLRSHLTEMFDTIELLLEQRSLPRKIKVQVQLNGKVEHFQTGTVLNSFLPKKVENFPVVAALLNQKIVSLSTQIFANAKVEALTTEHWEGERIYRRSATLLLLEAISQIDPEIIVKSGISIGSLQWFDVVSEINLSSLTKRILEKIDYLIAQKVKFRQEVWSVEEAISYFLENNRTAEAQLIEGWSQGTILLTSCGDFYVISMGPLVPDAELLKKLNVQSINNSLVLVTKSKKSASSFKTYANVMKRHARWIESLGISSVGSFNQSCITGKISEIIRVAEGFHEKKLGQIADQISARRDKLRVICVAGPSSSGKTTFLKRLKVQLQVNGFHPIGISLDDYYLDRKEIPFDKHGEQDFEALEALNLNLLRTQLQQILAGKTIKIPRFDFKTGESILNREIHLGQKNILLLEGIHGLNPKLLLSTIPEEQLFKIFIQPMTSLVFDGLSRINPSDIRLLRRIVRDRHQRNFDVTDNILRWPAVREGEKQNIFPFIDQADIVFDTSLIYEIAVLKVYAERYLLEVPRTHKAFATAYRLRQLISHFVAIYPDNVPPTSIIREFIGGSGFEY